MWLTVGLRCVLRGSQVDGRACHNTPYGHGSESHLVVFDDQLKVVSSVCFDHSSDVSTSTNVGGSDR